MHKMIASSRDEPGCLHYSYAEDVLEPGLIHVTEICPLGNGDAAMHDECGAEGPHRRLPMPSSETGGTTAGDGMPCA